MFFKTLNLFHITWFFFIYYSMNLYPLQKINTGNLHLTNRHPCYPWCTSMFPINICSSLKNLPFWYQFVNYFNQTIRNVSYNFYSLIVFFRVNRNSMITVLVLWLYQAFKFCTSSKLQLRDRGSLLFYVKRHSSVGISNVFLKALVECWKVQITVGCLSTSEKLLMRTLLIFPFLRYCMCSRWIFLLNSQKLIHPKNIFLSDLRN